MSLPETSEYENRRGEKSLKQTMGRIRHSLASMIQGGLDPVQPFSDRPGSCV